MRPISVHEIDHWASALETDGFCVMRGLFERELVMRWRAAFDVLWDERRSVAGGLAPRGPHRYYVSLPWVAPFDDANVFAHPAILGLLNRVFPQEYALVQLAADTPLSGAEYQEYHRDHRPLFSEGVTTPLYALTVNFPLCRVTPENGPLEIAPGTHKLSRAEALAKVASGEAPCVSVPMEPGDVMIRTPLAIHRGTPNRTSEPRTMVAMGYVMHWLHTPHLDLSLPRQTYEQLPDSTRKLIRCTLVDGQPQVAGERYVHFQY